MWLYLRPRLIQPHQLKEEFLSLAQQALADGRTQLIELAQEKLNQHHQAATQELSGKQGLIEKTLTTLQHDMVGKLDKVQTLMVDLDKQRHASHTSLEHHLKTLSQTTSTLHAALANSRTRGQWGERMAEDVLRLAGLQPHIQYRKQLALTAESGHRPRPDFTFFLPENRVIHMDVKFPLENYTAYLNAPDDSAKTTHMKAFLGAARQRIKETAARDYTQAATQAGETPLDYLLIFIPNEQIYAFLLENDPQLLEYALSLKVIPCSPTTLLAVLAMVHQASRHFALEQKSAEIFGILKNIHIQWDKFTDEMSKMGKKIDEAQAAFQTLTTTRSNMLDRQFNRLQALPDTTKDGQNPTPLLPPVA